MQDPLLVLRDIHQPPAPPWWPPAPGWWLLFALVLVAVATWSYWHRRRQRARRAIVAMFEGALAQAANPPAQIAAMSELLRRAARRRDAHADTLQGEAWLAFLDTGDARRRFSQGAGRLLLDGGFRRDADPQQVAVLRELARERFVGWMTK
jgi:cbb3-type cytochrome oxidase subunit 3